ncbi:unnamed protein product [Coffea canephora]|uniref:Peptidase A1 domain-containing protein n=1 Tax=Coffea canephora TaxID=49390 RepID=A0A068TSQ7_COFCA|nr:unnamed protein product [Coffea canephora]
MKAPLSVCLPHSYVIRLFSSMASLFPLVLICFCTVTIAKEGPFLPNSVILPVTKDIATHQYVTQTYVGDQPLAPTKLVIDISGSSSWIDSAHLLSSSGHPRPFGCFSLQCSWAEANSCTRPSGTSRNTCTLEAENPITNMVTRGELTEEIIAVQVTDGIKTGLASVPHFLFSCVPALLLRGLGDGVKGVLGLGNTRISLPSQVADAFSFQRTFSLCLSSSNGALIAGEIPYALPPNNDVAKSLMYTPLVFREGSKVQGYYINVKSIKINGKKLSINESMLSVNQEGVGGTKISTAVPYTTMVSTLYNTFIKAYIKAAIGMNMTMAPPVAPFGICFRSERLEANRDASNVPIIDLVLQSEMVKWRIEGRNSFVQVNDKVMCLGFLDGGSSSKASVVLGGYQLEDNLVEFKLGTKMLGFSALAMGHTTCSDLRTSYIPREAF